VPIGKDFVYSDSQYFGWFVVLESHEVAAPVEGVAGIVAHVAEPACVSVLELDAVEGWLGVGGGLGEA